MVTVADIKKDLPDWPDDVVDQWLVYFANEPDGGWPPPNPLGDHRWSRLFGGRPLSWWKEVSWKKGQIACSLSNFSTKAQSDVNGIISDVASGKADAVTKRRHDHAFHWTLNNSTFPMPILVMMVEDGYTILDGNHRMAAFSRLQAAPAKKFEELKLKKASLKQEAWVAKHARGEFPLT
jgi:hypothetical protein